MTRYNPGPDPSDLSEGAFRDEVHCRYDGPPPLWYQDPVARQEMYLMWRARKERELERQRRDAEAASMGNAKRFFSDLDRV